MKFRDKITANIDLKDAIFGGVSIYVSVFLLQYVLIFGADFLLRVFGVVNSAGEFTSTNLVGLFDNYGFFLAAFIAIGFLLFFTVVLFEEHLFSQHEKGWADLLGLGIVWGGVFVILDSLIQSFVAFVSLSSGVGSYLSFGLQSTFPPPFFFIFVAIITFLPISFFFLRKGKTKF